MRKKIDIKASEQTAGASVSGDLKNNGDVSPGGKAAAFWTAFLLAFIVLTIVLTPVMGAVSNYRPFMPDDDTDGEEGENDIAPVVLEQDFDNLVAASSPFYNAFADKKRMNCLLLGVKSGLTDTIMLISFDTRAQHVDIVSIPRDTYYHRAGYNSEAENKINAAYRKDPLNTATAVSEILLGVPINYYAVIEDEGVENIIDFIGGVPMNIEFDMVYSDPKDKPPLYINIPKGSQVLDGENAVKFLRYRKGYRDADIGRVKAQQEFMKSALSQALKTDLRELMNIVRENIRSDMSIGKMIYLLQTVAGMSGDSIAAYVLPVRTTPDPPYYVYPQTSEIEDMMREIYSLNPKDATGAAISNSAVSVDR
ncbi:MAG: LCP family protein [Clostridiales Family XIII bacterium]|jgi:LCP family protein required for cell wall assembly|nr:LCP family protein [Clostridiales Family XIII bacterium]